MRKIFFTMLTFSCLLLFQGGSLAKTPKNSFSAFKRVELQKSSKVAVYEPFFFNDPELGSQWALKNTGQTINQKRGLPGLDLMAFQAWKEATGKNITIAVLDSGITEIPDLHNKLAFSKSIFKYPFDDAFDLNGHGTTIGSIIAGTANNNIGVVGLAYESHLVNIKVSPYGIINSGKLLKKDYLAEGIRNIPEGTQIANISIGGEEYTDELKETIENNPQILFTVAAGNEANNNDSRKKTTYPCALEAPNILCVGSHNNMGKRSSFSNYGKSTVDVFAPGEDIRAMNDEGDPYYTDGTSFSAPYVAATAALLLEKSPQLTPIQIKTVIMNASVKDKGFRASVSGGRINAFKSLKTLKTRRSPATVSIRKIKTPKSIAKFKIKSVDSSIFECLVDNDTFWSGCEKNMVLVGKKMNNGKHKLKVRAINRFGQAGKSKRVNFFINSAKPKINNIRYQVISRENNFREVLIKIKAKGYRALYCGFYALKKCKRVSVWRVKKRRHIFKVKAVNKLGNSVRARFFIRV